MLVDEVVLSADALKLQDVRPELKDGSSVSVVHVQVWHLTIQDRSNNKSIGLKVAYPQVCKFRTYLCYVFTVYTSVTVLVPVYNLYNPYLLSLFHASNQLFCCLHSVQNKKAYLCTHINVLFALDSQDVTIVHLKHLVQVATKVVPCEQKLIHVEGGTSQLLLEEEPGGRELYLHDYPGLGDGSTIILMHRPTWKLHVGYPQGKSFTLQVSNPEVCTFPSVLL